MDASQAAALAPATLVIGQGMVVFARVVGLFIVVPFFGSMNIPMVVRVALAAALTMVITPIIGDAAAPGLAQSGGDALSISFLFLLVNQVLIGLMLGFVAAFVVYGIECAGRIIDTQRGNSMSDLMAATLGDRTSPSGQLLMMLALCLLVASGMHMLIIGGLVDSFKVLPVSTSLDWINSHSIGMFAELSGNVITIAAKVSAPALLSILLSDVLLGIINRGAPQVNVFMLSMPLKAFLGGAALLIAIVPTANYFTHTAFPDLLSSHGQLAQMLHAMNP